MQASTQQPGREEGQRFRFYSTAVAFEKADAPPGQRRRWVGIMTTDSKDRQEENILQHGLDFSPLLGGFGRINDNHGKSAGDVVGIPETVTFYAKGSKLPSGKVAKANCHWLDGPAYGDPHSIRVWEKAVESQKMGRPYGFSVEGQIHHRAGPDRKIIAKATVHHVAVTHVPVNTEATLEAVMKSLSEVPSIIQVEQAAFEQGLGETLDIARHLPVDGTFELRDWVPSPWINPAPESSERADKAITVGSSGPHDPPGPRSGAGAAALLAPESLERDPKKAVKQPMSKSDAVAFVARRYPHLRSGTALRLAEIAYAIAKGSANEPHRSTR